MSSDLAGQRLLLLSLTASKEMSFQGQRGIFCPKLRLLFCDSVGRVKDRIILKITSRAIGGVIETRNENKLTKPVAERNDKLLSDNC